MSRTAQATLFDSDRRSAPRTVILAADPLGVAGGHQPGRTPITPNERAARALRGGRVASVSLATRATRTLRTQGTFTAGQLTRLMALRQAIEADGSWSDVRGTARRLESVVSELLRAGIGVRPGLAVALDGSSSVGARTRRVARLALAYTALLEELGEVDPAEVLWRAAPAVRDREPLNVYGYARLGAGELEYLDALAGPGSVVVLPRGFQASLDAGSALAERGWDVRDDTRIGDGTGALPAALFTTTVAAGKVAVPAPPAPVDPGGGEPALRANVLADPEEEVRWVLARVKSLLASGTPPDEIVLVARDERAYAPLVRAVAAEFNVPLRMAFRVPLRESRLGEVAAGLISVIGRRLPFEETARLLRHPLVRALDDEAWANARAWHPDGPVEWVNAGAASAWQLAWPPRGTWSEYRRLLVSTLDALGVEARVEGRDRRAIVRLLKSLEHSTPRPGSAGAARTVELPVFLAHLGDLIDTVGVPLDPPGKGAVELHTPLAVFGARYRNVFVMGLSEGVFPQSVREDPVIDFQEREVLAALGVALEDAAGAAEREELSFLAVLHAAGDGLTLTAPKVVAGSERLPSPYFGALGLGAPEAAAPRAPASELESLIVDLPERVGQATDSWRVERRRESAEPPDAHDGISGVPVPAGGPFSATQLTSFGQCAFKWFGKYGLRLGELTEAEDDVSPLTAGSIFHDTLAKALMQVMEGPGTGVEGGADAFRAAVVDRLEPAYDLVNKEREERGERIRSKTWPLQKAENIEKLRRLVQSADFIGPSARVSDLERAFEARWRGLPVRGIVDRIDVEETPEGERLVLTDYKLGKSAPKGAKGARGSLNLDVQLPLYIEAAAPAMHPGSTVASARYLSINGAAVSKQVDPSKIDGEALDGLVTRFVSALQEGAFPLDPDPRQEACQYCPYDPVCRRGPRLSRKAVAVTGEGREEAA